MKPAAAASPGSPEARAASVALLPRATIARSFGAAARHYDAHAALQRQVATALLARLPQLSPGTVLDLGCGTGFCTQLLQQRWPQVALLALDIAAPMLQATARRVPTAQLLCADAEALPLAAASLDLVLSSLAIQWCRDYARLFAELARVTRPGASVLLSTFGPQSLHELRAAWAAVDSYTHVNQFAAASTLQHCAQAAGFRVELQRELIVEEVASLQAISRSLKQIGAHNMNRAQAQGLTSPRRFRQAAEAFAAGATTPGCIPLTWEVFYLVLERSHEANSA